MANRKETKYLVVHCAATDPEWHGPITADDIDKWHRERGWSEIGYHFYIRRSGRLERGRDLKAIGAHVKGYNANSVGICLEGGTAVTVEGSQVVHRPAANFTEAQLDTLDSLLVVLMELYPDAALRGHRDFPGVTKSCPSFNVTTWWETGEVEP